VVPRTTTLGKYNERQKRKAELEAQAAAETAAGALSSEAAAGASAQDSSSHWSPTIAQGFAGPSGHHRGQRSVDILENNDAMDVDGAAVPPQAPDMALPRLYQPMPSTAQMLEKARAASQRADSGPSPSSSNNPHPPPPPPAANA
jgi:hypothetical protein